MKILIDIGHPGHVHYFRNLMKELKSKNFHFIVTARNKEVTEYLLNNYQIPFIKRGKGKSSRLGKLIYMLLADLKLLFISLKNKPDLFLSFSSPYAAQVAFLLRKPHICLNDTEHTDKNHKLFTYPFSSVILTPESYKNDLGHKHIKFKSVVEYLYLNSKYYNPNPNIYNYLGIQKNDQFAILRFVSWKAFHDYGQTGIDIETKRQLVNILEKRFKVFISSEGELPAEFNKYKIKIPPEKMHDVLYYASLFVGESGTMASESALLGTPTIYINSLPLMCYLDLEKRSGILEHFQSTNGVIELLDRVLKNRDLKEDHKKKSEELTQTFINPTSFLVWFISNYPESVKIIKENPEFQNRFK